MTITRELVEETAEIRRYSVLNDGVRIGEDIEAIPTPAEVNERTMRDAARKALADNRTFLDISSPTNAQIVTQVRSLTRQNQRIIRLLLGLMDGVD